ncbi:Na+/H+ antiporter NhaA [Ornithinimicrobium tianjinense]|uniref:Na(+)/H(+) antiporter NhaA n=1 Tax=Ornithinimicrobium tianjinense TaxID=1195761 RepID=A0A917F914_9MICO|nr:Na+/H+ antiporter NhaA [Ornithinimicrobium tianjinense]GGF58787.1 Na(+)/H(+) antiporter NhaA [Ornithinimicrobium tianjinense]
MSTSSTPPPTSPQSTPPTPPTPSRTALGRPAWSEVVRVGDLLRKETVGGILLVLAAVLAIAWANSPWAGSYVALRETEVGYEPWHLRLSLGAWAADGLLAVFFFMVGLELKREVMIGSLRRLDRAVVPVAAAAGGVLVPALIYAAVNARSPELLVGWAIPTATDIAFAVAVLAIIGSALPPALRIFLLTLAVVDDLIAILIIALVYSSHLEPVMLLWGLLPLAVFALLARRQRLLFRYRALPAWLLLLPVGAVFWALVHASGIHATIAGVVLGLVVPARVRADRGEPDGPDAHGLAELLEHRIRPLSAAVAVPVFAFFSAGVDVGGLDGLLTALGSTVTIGIVLGLVVGKIVGITGTTWLVTSLTRSSLDPSLRWVDLVGVSALAGIGFTVSLLVAELSFGVGTEPGDHAKVGIFVASLLAAALGSAVLASRNATYRRLAAADAVDADQDGVPDVYETDEHTQHG